MDPTSKRRRVQKICTLWVHDRNFSEQDVVINVDAFQELGLKSGSLAKVTPLGPAVAVRDFQQAPRTGSGTKETTQSNTAKGSDHSTHGNTGRRKRRSSFAVTLDESGTEVHGRRDPDGKHAYVFVVQDATPEMKAKHQGLTISISTTVASVFGFRNRLQAVVALADSRQWASHVELIFKDQYLARSDMWRMVSTELANKTLYKGQKLLFMGTLKATVKHVYRDGRKCKSAFFAPSTKPIFRSESARYVLFIQMSREMWDFDSQGSGEIMFNKVINGFLPDLFKKWNAISARHLVTIVLFARVDFERVGSEPLMRMQRSTATSQDFYRVVVSDMASGDWVKILYQLKKEFRTFLRDISVNTTAAEQSADDSSKPSLAVIAGKPCPAARGNILEAINLASVQYAKDYIDRDLVRTGISIVVITAGTGVFEVDYSMLKLTTDTLVGSGIGMDLVSLSPMPLHSVPLFKYKNPQHTNNAALAGSLSQSLRSASTITASTTLDKADDKWRYAMPHWIDISFWSGTSEDDRQAGGEHRSQKGERASRHLGAAFNLRCRLYELQMMGVMENDMSNISIGLIHEHAKHPWNKLQHEVTGLSVTKADRNYLKKLDRTWMDEHDETVFEDGPPGASQQVAVAATSAALEDLDAPPELQQPAPENKQSVNDGQSRSNYLEWKLKSSPGIIASPVRRRDSSTTIASTTGSVKAKTQTKLSRQISFGAGRFGATKSAATAEVSLMSSTDQGPMFVKAASAKQPGLADATADSASQLKATLTRPSGVRRNTASSWESGHNSSRSQPISIDKNRPSTQKPSDLAGSQDTVKNVNATTNPPASPARSVTKDSGAILYIASANQRVPQIQKPSLSSSNEANLAIPRVLSPTSALAPWLVLVNPSNPKRNNFNSNSQFKRWQHVFPKPTKTSSIKWKSLCSPASVPLTNEFLPSSEQMREEYHESFYELAPAVDDVHQDAVGARNILVREMLSSRLSHGFQFVIGAAAAEWLGVEEGSLSHIFTSEYVTKDGDSALMSVGNTLHRITCIAGNQVAVRRFNRKAAAGMESLNGRPFTLVYKPYVRTALDKDYEKVEITLKPPRLEYNWNTIDNFLAGHSVDSSDSLRFWRARFVLIPVDLPRGRRNMAVQAEDTAEELRLEGIYKLTQLWQRHRVFDDDQGLNLRNAKSKDANPLAIEFQTRDPSAVVATGIEESLLADQDGMQPISQLFSDDEPYESSKIDLQRLAHDLQGEKGIKMLDRRWHLKLHYNCFVGFDLTGWLLARFRDINTREEAVELGNKLMEKGLFQHVQKKHNFRDGQYFYQIASEYRIRPESKAGWFRTPRSDKSIPATPSGDTVKPPLTGARSSSRPSTRSLDSDSGEKTPTKEEEGRRRVELSRMLRYDLDPRKRSYRPEVIDLHYDRLHNPDNCYHIRIDWMNVTAKLVEDAIVSWATTVERYGLKLVEVPIGEARLIGDVSPFRSPYIIKLAEPPPKAPAGSQYFDLTSSMSQASTDEFWIQKKLLQNQDFVLDVESASSFPENVDVSYSWGRPNYRYTQYIHKSGVLLVQITAQGDFLLLANRLYNNRAASAKEVGKFDKSESHDAHGPRRNISTISHGLMKEKDKDPGRWSPFASPLIRATPTPDFRMAQDKPYTESGSTFHKTAEQLKDTLEGRCSDVVWLRNFYKEAMKPSASPSPRLAPVSDDKIPMLGLPPSLGWRNLQSSTLQARTSRDSAGNRGPASPGVETEKSAADGG